MSRVGRAERSALVYSSERGRICPRCGWPQERCACAKKPAVPAGDGVVRVGRQTQGRRGKGVTVVTGLPLAGTALDELCTQLKKKCGAGGTVRDGAIEIQGDHRDFLVAELADRGYRVKRSGG